MATEQFANLNTSLGRAQTVINQGGGIASGDTSMVVAASTGFPASAQYRILIENEIIIVTGGAGTTTWTISRGAEGTTAAAHANGTQVTHVLTAAGLVGVAGSVHLSDTFANRPSPATAGRLFLPTNGYELDREDGSAWSSWGPLLPFVPPNDSLYSWVNQGSATVSTTHGGIFLFIPANASTNIAARIKSIPAAPYSVILGCLPMVIQSDFVDCGMFLEDSGTGNLITFGVAANSFLSTFEVITVVKYASPTASGTAYTTSPTSIVAPTWQVGPCMWFKIADDSTNRTFALSNDGVNFMTVLSTLRTDFITPDKIGFYVHVSNGSFGAGLNVLSFTGG